MTDPTVLITIEGHKHHVRGIHMALEDIIKQRIAHQGFQRTHVGSDPASPTDPNIVRIDYLFTKQSA